MSFLNSGRAALRAAAMGAGFSLACSSVTVLGVTAGQVDTFSGGSLENWTDGAGGNTTNITTGGPAGVGDSYLQVVSGTFGGQNRLVIFNQTQWLGNYVAAGVTSLTMDLKNFGTASVPIRVGIRQGSAGAATPGYASSSFSLPADGAWHTNVTFSLTSGMTAINSPAALTTDLANVLDFRILSSNSPALVGDVRSASIGIDNIRANSVPEPTSLAGAAVATVGLLARRRRRRCAAPQ